MNARKLRLESLEDRTLLAVTAGGIEQAAVIAPTGGQIWIVNTLEDPAEWDPADSAVSLREAIDAAADGDTITFASELAGGTVALSGKQLEVGKAITIDASSIGGITIDADGRSRVFYVGGGNEANPVELIGLTITGGNTVSSYGEGGGICNTGTLTITNSTISGNTASGGGGNYGDGGGIYNESGTLTITNSTISGNTASDDGGGIYNESGTLTITNSTVSGNTADWGGGICNDGTLTITNSTVSGNETFAFGGGINNIAGMLTLTGSTVTENYSDVDGGGIYNLGTLVVTNSAISRNVADWGGGGIYNAGALTITNTAISGNGTQYFGGGIYDVSDSSAIAITNSTISGNEARRGVGGGIYFGSDTAALTNTIVALNDAADNNDLDGSYSGSNNLIDTDPGFVVAPVFVDGKLVNADEIDLSLAAGSGAINAGTNDAVTTDTDIAGNPRIVGGTVDIGAYEYVGPVTPLGAPVITSGSRGIYISHGANRHYLQWGAVADASGYEVQYSTGGSSWTSVSTAGTGTVITGLTYGADVAYRVRALGTGSHADSAWSGAKSFNVCPMDVNGDGEISLADRAIVSGVWLADQSDAEYLAAADIDGDGEVSLADRLFLAANWLAETGDDDLLYPRAPRAADAVFAEYASAEPDVDSDLF
ncbi:MAG: hypothetical protein IK105_06160 [Thermoguttaceae bacterium]|nr:hypothetical protein [Thermoguttaceae bacterium]